MMTEVKERTLKKRRWRLSASRRQSAERRSSSPLRLRTDIDTSSAITRSRPAASLDMLNAVSRSVTAASHQRPIVLLLIRESTFDADSLAKPKVLTGRMTSRYDTIRDAILTCARKPTRVSLIYRTEPTTKKCKNRKKTKSRKQICSEITVNSPGNPRSEYLSRRKEGLQWERFAEEKGLSLG